MPTQRKSSFRLQFGHKVAVEQNQHVFGSIEGIALGSEALPSWLQLSLWYKLESVREKKSFFSFFQEPAGPGFLLALVIPAEEAYICLDLNDIGICFDCGLDTFFPVYHCKFQLLRGISEWFVSWRKTLITSLHGCSFHLKKLPRNRPSLADCE